MIKKRIVLVIVLVIIVVFITFVVCLKVNGITDVNELVLDDISVTESENKITLKGEIVSSGKSYYGYAYYYKNDALFIEIKAGLITGKHKDGAFEIAIENSKVSELNAIYLKDRNNAMMIYSK